MNQFLIQCDINADQLKRLDSLRPKHLSYIMGKTNVLYGGVMLDKEKNYKAICYVISADNIPEAEDFVKGDPYFEIYRKYEINNFIQKIPNYSLNEL